MIAPALPHRHLHLEALETRTLLAADLADPYGLVADFNLTMRALSGTGDFHASFSTNFGNHQLVVTGTASNSLTIDLDQLPSFVTNLKISSFGDVHILGTDHVENLILNNIGAVSASHLTVTQATFASNVSSLDLAYLGVNNAFFTGSEMVLTAQSLDGTTIYSDLHSLTLTSESKTVQYIVMPGSRSDQTLNLTFVPESLAISGIPKSAVHIVLPAVEDNHAAPIPSPASTPPTTPVGPPVTILISSPVAHLIESPVETHVSNPVATVATPPVDTSVALPTNTPVATISDQPITSPITVTTFTKPPFTVPVDSPVSIPISNLITILIDAPVVIPMDIHLGAVVENYPSGNLTSGLDTSVVTTPDKQLLLSSSNLDRLVIISLPLDERVRAFLDQLREVLHSSKGDSDQRIVDLLNHSNLALSHVANPVLAEGFAGAETLNLFSVPPPTMGAIDLSKLTFNPVGSIQPVESSVAEHFLDEDLNALVLPRSVETMTSTLPEDVFVRGVVEVDVTWPFATTVAVSPAGTRSSNSNRANDGERPSTTLGNSVRALGTYIVERVSAEFSPGQQSLVLLVDPQPTRNVSTSRKSSVEGGSTVGESPVPGGPSVAA